MARWKYRKPEPADVRGFCVICKTNLQRKFQDKYRPYCGSCEKSLYGTGKPRTGRKRIYRKYVADRCVRCGFIPEHICQLDVDHIDANHKNNAPDNLQTLCANCHRLKTMRER